MTNCFGEEPKIKIDNNKQMYYNEFDRGGINKTMRNIKEPVIKNAILHILNNREEFKKMSDYTLELDDKIKEFIKKHILKSVNDDKTRAAKFEGENNSVKISCNNIFENQDTFVKSSKEIANQLFISMSNKTISPADLIVVSFESNSKNYLALLKMDYNEIYRHDVEETEDGKTKTKLVVDERSSLPNLNQKLQKSAFIQPENNDNNFDIVILDKQTNSKSADQDIAQFFLRNFLNAKLEKDDKHKTRVFKNSTIDFVNEKYEDSKEREEIISYMYNTLERKSQINIREFSDVISEENQEEYVEFLISEDIGDYEFKPDKEIINNKKVVIKTREDIQIRLDKVLYDEKRYIKVKTLDDGGYEISIKTDNYDYNIK